TIRRGRHLAPALDGRFLEGFQIDIVDEQPETADTDHADNGPVGLLVGSTLEKATVERWGQVTTAADRDE
ncbi:MAG: hypothetical protein AAFY56_20610, partial [Pseudomonadota bacterium]